MKFTSDDITRIAETLGLHPIKRGTMYRFQIENAEHKRKLNLEIYADIPIGKKNGNLISVYTHNAHLQLHFCSGFVVSSELGEVTFIGEHGGVLSGLIVEREGGCSLYANVDRSLLTGDFTKLGPEVMLSGIALSLTEDILSGEANKR